MKVTGVISPKGSSIRAISWRISCLVVCWSDGNIRDSRIVSSSFKVFHVIPKTLAVLPFSFRSSGISDKNSSELDVHCCKFIVASLNICLALSNS